jgi:hypothetical protein
MRSQKNALKEIEEVSEHAPVAHEERSGRVVQ